MGNFDSLKKEIEKILQKSPLKFELVHSELTLKYVLKLKPDADEALRIAALAHDFERGITGITEKDIKDFSSDLVKFKKEHGIRSAKFVSELMKKNDYDENTIIKTAKLIENHEFGGDEETNILVDADSLAYFEYNTPFTLERMGVERTKNKIKFMYKRMSEKAKRIVHQLSFKTKEINELFQEAISEI